MNALYGASFLAVVLALPACEGNHSALAPDPDAGGSGGQTGEGGGGADAGGMASGGSGVGGLEPPVEPPGDPVVTVVNGLVDRSNIQLCIRAADAVGTSPWPSQPLSFGDAVAVETSSIAPMTGQDGELTLLTGDLASLGAVSCEELIADPMGFPSVTITVLGALPASVFAEPRSLLFVVMGCLGGPSSEHPNEALACGASYSSNLPTVSLLAAGMSRLVEPGKVGFQVAQAAIAVPESEVRLRRGADGAVELTLVDGLTPLQVGPFPAFAPFALADLGTVGDVELSLYSPGAGTALDTTLFAEILPGSPVDDLQNSRNFTAVAIGASPLAPASASVGGFWNDFRYVLLANDPLEP